MLVLPVSFSSLGPTCVSLVYLLICFLFLFFFPFIGLKLQVISEFIISGALHVR